MEIEGKDREVLEQLYRKYAELDYSDLISQCEVQEIEDHQLGDKVQIMLFRHPKGPEEYWFVIQLFREGRLSGYYNSVAIGFSKTPSETRELTGTEIDQCDMG